MLNVFGITAPIYLLIAAGFIAVRLGWMAASDMRILGRFVAQFCVPALLFRAVTRQPLAEVVHADFLLVYAGGSLLALSAVLLYARRFKRAPISLAAVQALGLPPQTASSLVIRWRCNCSDQSPASRWH